MNTMPRNLVFEGGDVIVHFSTAYGACEKTIDYICETTTLQSRSVMLEYPTGDVEVVQMFIERVGDVYQSDSKVKIAMVDTVLTFSGMRMPWEALVNACKIWGIWSLIDGAHGIGHIDLSHLEVRPNFFTSNCFK
jgi:selenocysteine lyase/cysteine desulfurase